MKARAASGAREGLWLRAEQQSGGVGRLGRKWESPAGNLYCSTLVEAQASDPIPSSLSFVAALAVYETIEYYLPHDKMQLKWPNDILVSGSKICGILLESAANYVVVGIGINIAIAPAVTERSVTSLHEEGCDPDVTAAIMLNRLADNFEAGLRTWRLSGLSAILSAWQKRAHPEGTRLSRVDEKGITVEGAFAGLSDDGALRLRKADGELIEIHAGDIHVG